MAEAPYLMGIDFGTGGVRVGLFDRQGAPPVFQAVELQHPSRLGRVGPGRVVVGPWCTR